MQNNQPANRYWYFLTHTDKNGVQATRMVDESGNEDVAKN
jgi:macrodomain Ter protein organizer (MatP/YcbG family)